MQVQIFLFHSLFNNALLIFFWSKTKIKLKLKSHFCLIGDDNIEAGEGGEGGEGSGKKKSEKKVFMVQEIETKLTEQQAR